MIKPTSFERNTIHSRVLAVVSSVEPFVDRIQTGGSDEYRVGYRTKSGDVVSFIAVPARLAEIATWADKSINVTLTPDGMVVASPLDLADSDQMPFFVVPIDELVKDVLRVENLHLEETRPDDLYSLLRRLEVAATLVRSTIGRDRR